MAIRKIKTKNHEEWLALRHKYLGGSDAAAAIGLSEYATPYSLWAEKTDRAKTFEGNLATETGTFLEPFVASLFARETGLKIRNNNFSMLNDAYPWAIANIDREIVGKKEGLEIKTVSALRTKKFRNGEYPPNFYCQCVHYLAVTGYKRWHLAVLIGNNDFRTFVIERDEDEIKALMDSEESFWKYVTDDVPPPVDGESPTTNTIDYQYGQDDGGEMDLFGMDYAMRRYMDIGAEIEKLKTERDECANEIKVLMGASAKASSDSFRVNWKTQVRRTFDAKAFAKENPDLDLTKYYKESVSRPFKITEIKENNNG